MNIFWERVDRDKNFREEEASYEIEDFDELARGHYSRYVILHEDNFIDLIPKLDPNYVVMNRTFKPDMFYAGKKYFTENYITLQRFCLYTPFAAEVFEKATPELTKILKINGISDMDLSFVQLMTKAQVESIGTTFEINPRNYARKYIPNPINEQDLDEFVSLTKDIDDFRDFEDLLDERNKIQFQIRLDEWKLLSANPIFTRFIYGVIDPLGFSANPNITDEYIIENHDNSDVFDIDEFAANRWLRGERFNTYSELLEAPPRGLRYNWYLRSDMWKKEWFNNSYDISNMECKPKKPTKYDKVAITCKDVIHNPSIPFKYLI